MCSNLQRPKFTTTWRTVGEWSPLEAEVDGDLGHDERGDDAGDQIHAVVVQYLLPWTYKRLYIIGHYFRHQVPSHAIAWKKFNILQHSKILHIQEDPQQFLNLFHRLCLTSRQCCGSGILIRDLESWFLSNNSNQWENLLSHPFFVTTNFTKIKLFYFLTGTEKNLSQLTKNYLYFSSKKLSPSSQKYGLGNRDPRSRILKKPIPDPGSKKAPDPWSYTQHCHSLLFL